MPKMTQLQALRLAQNALETLRYGYEFLATDQEAREAAEILFNVQKCCPEGFIYAAQAGVTALAKMTTRFGYMATKRLDKALGIMPALIKWADREEQSFYMGCLMNLRQFTEALEVEW